MILGRLLVLAAAIAAPSLAAAQTSAQVADPATTFRAPAGEAVAGPRLSSERVGVAPVAVTADPAGAVPPAQARLGQSVALMAVGGAALVAGLIIGGDAGTILALGGAVVGLVGLYQYLR